MASGTIKKSVSEIISDIQSFSISANAAAANYSFTISVPDGYTFVCPGSWMVSNLYLHVYGVVRKSSTEITIYAENDLSSIISCQVTLIFAR